MNLIKAMATVAGLTGLSRIAGFVRDILTAAILGAGPLADAFFVALKLPNFFRRVTAEGAFSVAFVPIYAKRLESEGEEKATLLASNAFMVMLSLLSVFTLLALLAMPYIIMALAPGFDPASVDPCLLQGALCSRTEPWEMDMRYFMAVEFSRITFPYLLLMSLTALLGGVLNAHERFAPFAFAPVLFNVSLIVALLLSNYFESAGHALSWGLLAAGVFQLAFLWACTKRAGVNIKIARPRIDVDTKKIFAVMGPAVIGAGVVHINLFADLIIASFLGEGSISYLYYADRLNQLPLGVVGIAVGTALLPMLSKAMTKENGGEAKHLFNRALEYCLLLALPAAVALAVMPLTLITVLFERGAFSAEDSMITANVLVCYAIGLPAYIAIKVFSTAHWARHDTKTPVKISVVATLLNIGLSLVFIQFMGVAGIALATGLTGWVQFIAHVRVLKDHSHAQLDQTFKRNILKIILSSCVMAAALYILGALLHSWVFEGTLLYQLMALTILVVGGMFVYAMSILLSGAVQVRDVKTYLIKGKGQRS